MAADLPNPLQLREIKYGTKATHAERAKIAHAYLASGRTAEALELFLLAGDEEGVRRVRALAVEEGRPILLLALERAGRPCAAEEWKRTGDAAFAAGRWREAFRAYARAGDDEALQRVKEKIPDYEIYTPRGK
ncbi:MAG: hypothetical protein ACREID_00710 [Planctomycetota bacterium]